MKKEISKLNKEEALKNLIKIVKLEGYEKIENHNIEEYEQLLLNENIESDDCSLKNKTIYEKISIISKKLDSKKRPVTIKINHSWANVKEKAEIDTICLYNKCIGYKDKATGLTLSGLFVALYRDNFLYDRYPIEVVDEVF